MYMERQFAKILAGAKKLEAEKEDNERATKIDPYAIEVKGFSSQYRPSPIESGGLQIPLVVKFSTSE